MEILKMPMMKARLGFFLMIFLSCFMVIGKGVEASPLPEVNALVDGNTETNSSKSLKQEPKLWKECPKYASFYGDIENDYGCCLDENTCSSTTSTEKDSWNKDMPNLLRSKRSPQTGDIIRQRDNQLLNDNLARGDSKLVEISLCESKVELLRPVFGSVYATSEQVQIYQFKPFLIQTVLINKCIEKPTLFLRGECRQKYEPQEMFIVSPNSTMGNVPGGIGIDRVFLAVPTGCSMMVDSTQILSILNMKKESDLNKVQTIIKSEVGTQVNYHSYSGVRGNTASGLKYQDMTISDQPSSNPLENNDAVVKQETEVGGTIAVQDQKRPDASKLTKSDSKDSTDDAINLVGVEDDTLLKVHEEKGSNNDNGFQRNHHIGSEKSNDGDDTVTLVNQTNKRIEQHQLSKQSQFIGNNKEGTLGGDSRSDVHTTDGSSDNVQNVPIQIEMPIYFGSSSLDPIKKLVRDSQKNVKVEVDT